MFREMKKTVGLIPDAFAGSRCMDEYLSPSDDIRRPSLVAPEALTNPQHIKFALKGCLAASLCYAIIRGL